MNELTMPETPSLLETAALTPEALELLRLLDNAGDDLLSKPMPSVEIETTPKSPPPLQPATDSVGNNTVSFERSADLLDCPVKDSDARHSDEANEKVVVAKVAPKLDLPKTPDFEKNSNPQLPKIDPPNRESRHSVPKLSPVRSEVEDEKRPSAPPPVPPGKRVTGDNGSDIANLSEYVAGGRLDDAKDLSQPGFVDTAWYEQIFNDDYLKIQQVIPQKQSLKESKFVAEALGLESDALILDLACGSGRVTIPMAKFGYQMVGLDLSMTLLQHALKTAQNNQVNIKFIHGDMRSFSFENIFDGVINLQASFGYFDDRSNFKILQNIFRALKKGGRFLIDTINRDYIVDTLPYRILWEVSGHFNVLDETRMDFLTGRLCTKRTLVYVDQLRAPWEQEISFRIYSATELVALLKRAGFAVVEISGSCHLPCGVFFGADSPRLMILAEKPC